MKRTLLFFLATALFAQQRHVVLISIDGGAAYHLENPALEIPNIRQMLAAGAWADGGSETVFPSITFPAHTTIITGVYPIKHGVLANEMVRGPRAEIVASNSLPRTELVLAKTLFDTAKQKGLSTAAFMWPETVADPAIDYNFTYRTTSNGARELTRGPFTEELEKAGVPLAIFASLREWDMQDQVTAMAACETIRRHRPTLVAVHFVQTDGAQHTYGPHSEISRAEFARTDRYIGQIVRAVKDAGIRRRL
jgi:predicted AlkP superfamily pyrophosphatase or phosphodiesterase